LRQIVLSLVARQDLLEASAWLSEFSEGGANRFAEVVNEELYLLRDRLDILRPALDTEATAYFGRPTHKHRFKSGSSSWQVFYGLTEDAINVFTVRHGAARPLTQENNKNEDE